MTNFKHILQIAAVAASLAMAPPAFAQNAYPTPEAAADALVDGIARHDDRRHQGGDRIGLPQVHPGRK